MTTPYDVPLGEGEGSSAFRLMPADELHTGPSTVSVADAAAGRAVLITYTWAHPADGPQTGTLLLGVPDEDGSASAAWVDSWHQGDVVQLTGASTPTGAVVAYEYAPGWTWEIEAVVEAGTVSLVMRNGVPASDEGPATRYETMRARWS